MWKIGDFQIRVNPRWKLSSYKQKISEKNRRVLDAFHCIHRTLYTYLSAFRTSCSVIVTDPNRFNETTKQTDISKHRLILVDCLRWARQTLTYSFIHLQASYKISKSSECYARATTMFIKSISLIRASSRFWFNDGISFWKFWILSQIYQNSSFWIQKIRIPSCLWWRSPEKSITTTDEQREMWQITDMNDNEINVCLIRPNR